MIKGKTFNVTGVCIPDKHYMADISERLGKITTQFIDPGMYFTMNRARQFGKTTTLYLLEKYLQGRYLVISLSFEAADDLFTSRYAFATGFVRRVGRKLSQARLDDAVSRQWNETVSREFPMEDLSDKISDLNEQCSKKIVLMIDEVDKSSDNQIFLSFLGMLRTKYLAQQQGVDDTFHSVILAGVYDIKNLKLKLHPGEESKYNSPWNVAADFNVDMNLSVKEIKGMLDDYSKDQKADMNTEDVAQEIYNYTSGYPFLVSKICKRIAEDLNVKKKWSRYGVAEAVKMILSESNTLFDDMRKKITDYPELRTMLYAMLFQGQSFAYNPDNFAIDVGCMFGFIREEEGRIAVSNRIFETRLYNLFLSEDMLNSQTYLAGERFKTQFVSGHTLNMELVLERFAEHFSDIYGDSDERFLEENGRRLFLLYLKPIINGTGNYYIESRTRSMGRTDVIVDYLGQQYVIEMKIWHGNEYNMRGEKQLMRYLDDYHLKKGYMISFNFNKQKKTGVKKIQFNDKCLIEAVV